MHSHTSLVLPSNIMDIGSRRFEEDDATQNDGVLSAPSSLTLLRNVTQPNAFVIPPLSNVSNVSHSFSTHFSFVHTAAPHTFPSCSYS
jgi:hypothetical protein